MPAREHSPSGQHPNERRLAGEELPQSIVRNVEPNEMAALPKNMQDWTSGLIELPGTKSVLSSTAFAPTGCFVAEDKESVVGFVAVTNFPRKYWRVIVIT